MPVVVAAMGASIIVLAVESPDALLPFVVATGVVVLPLLLFVSSCGSGSCVDLLSLPLFSAGVDGDALMLLSLSFLAVAVAAASTCP